MAGRALASVLKDFPEIRVEKVSFVTERKRAREAGVSGIPTLVYGDRKLSGMLLTKGKIRQFIESLETA